MGLRLRERRGIYTVEPNQDGDAVKLRTRLAAAGIDTGAIEKALNNGEAVVPSPAVTMVPSPLPHDVWESTIFERKIAPRSLFSAIVRDRRASLLFYGLLSMTPETRAYLANDRAASPPSVSRRGRSSRGVWRFAPRRWRRSHHRSRRRRCG